MHLYNFKSHFSVLHFSKVLLAVLLVLAVADLSANTVPTITDLSFGSVAKGGGPMILDGSVTLVDLEGNFDGGTLSLSGAISGDVVSIRNVGTGAGEIGFDAGWGSVRYGGTEIGSVYYGVDGANLSVLFNANATVAAIEALIENLTLSIPSGTGSDADREITLGLLDDEGGALAEVGSAVSFATAEMNAFGLSNVETLSIPGLADLDNDGDIDMMVGYSDGSNRYFINGGTTLEPLFILSSDLSPHNISSTDTNQAYAFIDIDDDGDLDVLRGENNGDFTYYKNVGSVSAPDFDYVTNSSPFGLTDVGAQNQASFVDIDGDGDLDAFTGEADSNTINFFRNGGPVGNPVFTQEGGASPFGLSVTASQTRIDFADIDNDGDYDAFIGESGGGIIHFENTGTSTAPSFTEDADTTPFDLTDIGKNAAPRFADMDGDGDQDLFVGELDGDIYFFENLSKVSQAVSVVSAPTVTGLPSDIDVVAETASAVDLSASNFVDSSGSGSLTVTLTASTGTLAASSGGGVTVGGSGTDALTLAGSFADVNGFLDTATNIQYTGAGGVSGDNAATMTVEANDGIGSGDVTLGTVNFDMDGGGGPNADPTLTGLVSDVAVTEDVASDVDLSAAAFADADSSGVALVTLTASAGTLSASSGGGVTVAGSGTSALSLFGTFSSVNSFLDTASNVRYTGAANASGDDAATLTVEANDGDGSGDVTLGTVNIDITGVNDAPTVSGLAGDVSATEDLASNVDLTASAFGDVDSSGAITVTLTASSGTLSASSGGGVTVGGSGTAELTLSGTVADINGFLDTASNVQYIGAENVWGDNVATLTIAANDSEGSGDVSFGVVNIDIVAVNDAPALSGLVSDVSVSEEMASSVNLSASSFSDVDSAGVALVTLTASSGTLSATSGSGVGIGGTGTGELTLLGTFAAINSFLDTSSNLAYTGGVDVTGEDAATLTVEANDDDGSGDVLLGTVNFDIAALDDAPTLTGLASDVTVVEDVASAVDLSASAFADVDSAGTATVSLQASAGTLVASSGGGVAVSGSGTTELILTGTFGAINGFLDTAAQVQYTSALNESGENAATLAVEANDGDGSGDVYLGTVNFDITAVNDLPTVTGLPSDISASEETASSVDLSASIFADVDSPGTVSVLLTASSGTLSATSVGGVSVVGSGTDEVILSGTIAAINGYLDTASHVLYTGAEAVTGENAASLAVEANDEDGSGDVLLGTINIDIASVANAPTLGGLVGDLAMTEDTAGAVDLSASTLADADTVGAVTVKLVVSAGTLSAESLGGVSVSGSGTAELTLVGTIVAINGYLDTAANVLYLGAGNAWGENAATLGVEANDGEGSGDVSLGMVNLDIAAVNDAPTLAGLASDLSVTEDALSEVDLSAAAFADVDSAGAVIVTLTVDEGSLTATSGSGVTAVGSGTDALTLFGTFAGINGYLDTANRLQYLGAEDATGEDAALLTVKANDGEGSGDLVLGTMNLDITGVNDAPTIAGLASDLAVTEDMASLVDLSASEISDTDSFGVVTVILAASSGAVTAESGGGVTVGGSGTGVLALSGTFAAINGYLDTAANVQYVGANDVSGEDAATLTVRADDGDGSGEVVLGTVNLDIAAVNDAPAISGLGSAVTVIEDAASAVDLSAVSLVDADSSGDVEVTLTASEGTLSAASGGGVTVSGSGTSELTLSGTLVDINAYLDDESRIEYLGAADASGDGVATITVLANDGNGSGDIVLGELSINVTGVNDGPELSGFDAPMVNVGGGPTVLDDDVTVVDPEGNFDGSVVTIGGAADGDTLSILNEGSGLGQIGYNATTGEVSFEGTVIGVASGGANGADLEIVLNGNATTAAVETLLESVTLDVPEGGGSDERSIVIELSDDAGAELVMTELDPEYESTEASALGLDDLDAGARLNLVDIDGDGDLDAFAANADGSVYYFENAGTASEASFEARAENFGLSSLGALPRLAFVDIDNDGDADAFVGSEDGTVRFWRNEGDADAASFVLDVDEAPFGIADLGSRSAPAFVDIDADGDFDLFVGSADGSVRYFLNTGSRSSPAFQLDAAEDPFGLSDVGTDSVLVFADADVDVDFDAVLENGAGEIFTFRNAGTAMAADFEIDTEGLGFGESPLFADIDGDGDLDVFEVDSNGGITLKENTVGEGVAVSTNQLPTITGLPDTVSTTEESASHVDLSGVSLEDADGSENATVALSASEGTLAAASSSGVTVTGSGTGEIVLSGTLENIDAYLNDPARISYTGAENATGSGAATIAVVANDGSGSGDASLGTISIDIEPPNAEPTGFVSVFGIARQGETLVAGNSLEDADGLGDISYQWLRGGVEIAGATGMTYELSGSDVGFSLQVRASYVDGLGKSELPAVSATTAIVGQANRDPIAGADAVRRFSNRILQIPVVSLLSNDSDADGGSGLLLMGVSDASESGGDLDLAGGYVIYDPKGYEGEDRFRYILSDGEGGVALGEVRVEAVTEVDPLPKVRSENLMTNGVVEAVFVGTPFGVGVVQRSVNLVDWIDVEDVELDESGEVSFRWEKPLEGVVFYRLMMVE